jgi:hypothetical protein
MADSTTDVMIEVHWPTGTDRTKREAAHDDLLASLDSWGERWTGPESIKLTVRSQIS